MIAVILSEKNQGIQSSGIQFCFWGALVIYAGIKLRSLILISRDQVCTKLCPSGYQLNCTVGASLSEPHHVRSTVSSCLLVCLYACHCLMWLSATKSTLKAI